MSKRKTPYVAGETVLDEQNKKRILDTFYPDMGSFGMWVDVMGVWLHPEDIAGKANVEKPKTKTKKKRRRVRVKK